MGNNESSTISYPEEVSNRFNGYPWPKDKELLVKKALNSGNPKLIDFKKWQHPVEDPVDVIVPDAFTTKKHIKLKTYMYPAYHDFLVDEVKRKTKIASNKSNIDSTTETNSEALDEQISEVQEKV